MNIKNNCLVITEAENKILQAKLDLVETPSDWLQVLRELWAEADLQLEINWNPTLQSHKKWSDCIILGFKGNISGKNIDVSGKKRSELYSTNVSVGKTIAFGDKEVLRISDTGGGGGGDNWRYAGYVLNVEDFPLMKQKYSLEIDEVFVKSTREKFQEDYNKSIDKLTKSFNSNVNDFVSNDKDVKEAKQMTSKLLDLVEKMNNYSKKCEQIASDKAKQKFKFDVPVCKNAFLDISKSNYAFNIQCLSDGTKLGKETLSELEELYNDFVGKHAEKFI